MAPRIHHLNCGTMCPYGGALLGGHGGPHNPAELVCHVLLIEAGDSLVLVDTGFGVGDVEDPARLGRPFRALIRPQCAIGETALRQVAALGFEPSDVRHIAVTHLDIDHAGGLGDFGDAEVHVFATEHGAAMNPSWRERQRYRAVHWAHGPKWVTHDVAGDRWFGFESVRAIPGLDPEILLIPLAGHSRGHSGVAVRDGEGWLLHCGDAYFHQGEVETPPRCPPGLSVFQTLIGVDDKARRHNRERLRELAREHSAEVTLLCSHDPRTLAGAAAGG